MRPESKQPRTPETSPATTPIESEYDFLIPEVFAEYNRRLPEFVGQFTDEQLIGRGNNIRFEAPLRTWEDGYVADKVVMGMFEPHINNLMASHVFLARRMEVFQKLVADGTDPRTAEAQATQSVRLMAIPYVEKAHDPVVQKEISKELLRRSDAAVRAAEATFSHFKSTVIAQYRATDVKYPHEVAQVLFTRSQAPGQRVHPEVKKRYFDLLAELDTAEPDTRSFLSTLNGQPISTTLPHAKMHLVYELHAREVEAGLKFGKKLDLGRIREKFEPMYNQLGFPYQDPQLQMLPSRLREGAIVTGLALRAGSQVMGRGVETAARAAAQNVETVTRVGSVGILSVGLLAPLAQGTASAERPVTSISQLVTTDKLPTVDLNAQNVVALSALPSLEASASVRAGEKCATPFVYTDSMKQAVANIKAKGGKWKDEAIILDFFLEKCMGIQASTGIVGNAEEESGSNPARQQIGGPAQGDFMWEGGRLARLLKKSNPHTHKTQLPFAWDEMKKGSMIDDLRKATSPEHGAEIFERLFERAGVPHMDVRKGHARDLYNLFLVEYKKVEQSSYAAHNAPKAAGHASSKSAPTAALQTDFARLIGENLASGEPAINALNQSEVKEQDAAVAAKAQALSGGIENALATSAADAAPSFDALSAADQLPASANSDNTPHTTPIASHDFTAAIAQAIATRQEASAVPAILESNAAPDGGAQSGPALAPADIQAALAAPVTTVEQTPLPSAPSGLAALPPVAVPGAPITPPAAILAETAPPVSTPSTSTPAAVSTLPSATTTPAPAEISATPIALSGTPSASLLPATPEAAPSQPDSSETSLADSTTLGSTTAPATTNPGDNSASLADAAPVVQQPSNAQPVTPASPILPPLTPAPVEKKADTPKAQPETAKSQSTIEQRRQAEIERLKKSGDFKKSQALDDAQRSPLEKKLESDGQKNGRLKDVERLGGRWGDASLYAPAAEQFRKLDAAYHKEFGKHIVINDSYRSYARQVATKADAVSKGRPQFAATPGHSKHGWGLALDLGGGMQSFDSKEYKWMLKHALDFGFNHPDFADDSSSPEPWHWEYVLSE